MTTLVSDFPLELISEILSRLPVKSLLKFRRVCKDWLNVIDSKDFVNRHLTQREKNPVCLVVNRVARSCYSLDPKSYANCVELDIRSWWPRNLAFDIWGSCNGLICCSSSSSSSWKYVALWNPSTKKHLNLPPLSLDNDSQLADQGSIYYEVALGFGFDFAVGDYKVVSILHYSDSDCTLLGTEVKVFSLRSNLWRRIYGLPKGFSHRCSKGVLVGESLYWLLNDWRTGGYSSILAFDLKTDQLRLHSLPRDATASLCSYIAIKAIDGCLSIGSIREDIGFELWVMDEFKEDGSWTKLISIHDPIIFSYNHLFLVDYRKDVGMLLVRYRTHGFLNCPQFVWYNFETKAVEEVSVTGLPDFFLGTCVVIPKPCFSLPMLTNYNNF